MSGLLPKRVIVHPGQVFCENCGSIMYIGRYRQTQNYLTAECLSQHCVDRGSVFKLPLDARELERETPDDKA